MEAREQYPPRPEAERGFASVHACERPLMGI
jgi:hypothetical protein